MIISRAQHEYTHDDAAGTVVSGIPFFSSLRREDTEATGGQTSRSPLSESSPRSRGPYPSDSRYFGVLRSIFCPFNHPNDDVIWSWMLLPSQHMNERPFQSLRSLNASQRGGERERGRRTSLSGRGPPPEEREERGSLSLSLSLSLSSI